MLSIRVYSRRLQSPANRMKRFFLVFLLLVGIDVAAQDIVRVSKAEYDRHQPRQNQVFDTFRVGEAERQATIKRYYYEALDDNERALFACRQLSIHVGVFTPSGIKAVYVRHPQYGLSRLYLNGMIYNYVYCDTFALSLTGILAVSTLSDSLYQSTLTLLSVRGWDLAHLYSCAYHVTPYEFRFTSTGWLYFRGGYDYYKIRVPEPVYRENTLLDDLVISHEEFLGAQRHAKRYNLDRLDRQPSAGDTAAARLFAKSDNILFQIVLGESYSGQFGQGGPAFIELSAGDYCVTRLLVDTTFMPCCDMMLSGDNLLAGVYVEEGAGPVEVPAFIYIYPYPEDSRYVAAPYVYQTTPAWVPSGINTFWGADGWFYVEGWDWRTSQSTYHKVRLPRTTHVR